MMKKILVPFDGSETALRALWSLQPASANRLAAKLW